jgi:hypothetical protein
MERFDPPGDHKHFPSFISAVVFLCAYLVLSRIFREDREHLCSSFPFVLRVAVAFLHMVKAVPNRLTGLDYPSLLSIRTCSPRRPHLELPPCCSVIGKAASDLAAARHQEGVG